MAELTHLKLRVSRMMVEVGVERKAVVGCHPQWKYDHHPVAHLSGIPQNHTGGYIPLPGGEDKDASENYPRRPSFILAPALPVIEI